MVSAADLSQIDAAEQQLMSLADDMAEAATKFNGQGYDAFLTARELFKSSLDAVIISLKEANTRINKIHAIVEGRK